MGKGTVRVKNGSSRGNTKARGRPLAISVATGEIYLSPACLCQTFKVFDTEGRDERGLREEGGVRAKDILQIRINDSLLNCHPVGGHRSNKAEDGCTALRKWTRNCDDYPIEAEVTGIRVSA